MTHVYYFIFICTVPADPDMLEVGNGGMTYQEYRAHFSIWALMKVFSLNFSVFHVTVVFLIYFQFADTHQLVYLFFVAIICYDQTCQNQDIQKML